MKRLEDLLAGAEGDPDFILRQPVTLEAGAYRVVGGALLKVVVPKAPG